MDRGHIWNRQDTGSWGMELATPGLWAVNDCIRFYSHCIFSRSTMGRFYLLSSIIHGISIKNKKIRRFKVTLFIHLLCSIHSQKFNIIYSKQCTDPPTDRQALSALHSYLLVKKKKKIMSTDTLWQLWINILSVSVYQRNVRQRFDYSTEFWDTLLQVVFASPSRRFSPLGEKLAQDGCFVLCKTWQK